MAVFAYRGDLRRLSCDAWYLPCDSQMNVAEYWRAGDKDLAAAIDDVRHQSARDWWQRNRRVHPLPLRDGRRAVPVLAAIPVEGTNDWSYHRETLRQFVDAAVELDRPEHLRDRPRRLLAVPLIGTGRSTWKANRAEHLSGLLTAVEEECRQRQVDIVVVAHNAVDWSATQAMRRRLQAQREIDPELRDVAAHAERLADLARQGKLVLFTGAGISRPAGLPDWRELLTTLAKWAGLDEAMAARLSEMDLLDQAAVIGGRRGEKALADEVAKRLEAPHHSLAHALLANLPVRENVTLNYDQLFELAAKAAGNPVAVLPYEPARERWLLKLHGCVAPGRRHDIVLTRGDYLSLGQHRATLTGLVQALLVTRHMLFVGFGLADDHFHAVIHDVRRALGGVHRGKLGTALLLEHDELQEELWKNDLDHVAVGGAPTAEAARRLEMFLDHLLLLATTSDAHLFDHTYAGLLTDDERRLRDLLGATFGGKTLGDSPAGHRVRALLQEFGWRDRSQAGVLPAPKGDSMTAIDRGHVCESRHDFTELLRWWLETTAEETVGEPGAYGGKAWIHVETGSGRCHLNADTSRAGVRRFLDLVREHGPDLEWRVTANQKGKINRVALGPGAEKVKKLYLYTDEELPAPTVL